MALVNRKRHTRHTPTKLSTVDPIKRDRIMLRLMRKYSDRKITLEQIKKRDPQKQKRYRSDGLVELFGK